MTDFEAVVRVTLSFNVRVSGEANELYRSVDEEAENQAVDMVMDDVSANWKTVEVERVNCIEAHKESEVRRG